MTQPRPQGFSLKKCVGRRFFKLQNVVKKSNTFPFKLIGARGVGGGGL